MKKIGIRFHDNDFYNTLQGFFRILADAMLYNRHDLQTTLTKAHVVDLFNRLGYETYQLYQHGFRPPNYDRTPEEDRQHLTAWLTLKEEHVLFDDEVDEYLNYMREHQNNNGEFQYFDIEGTLNQEMTGQRLEPVIVCV